MRIRNIYLTCFIVLIISETLAGQSGRTIPPAPAPTPEPSLKAEPVQPPPCETGLDETIYIYQRPVKDFVDELNKLGRCGYRMDIVGKVTGMNVFGTVRRDPENNKYEYRWFAAGSGGEVVTLANDAGQEGFYFRRSMMFFSGESSTASDKENDPIGTNLGLNNFPGNGSLYIFERKNGVVKRREYRMINGADKRGPKALAANQANLNDKLAQGFRPVGIYYAGMFDVFQILVEKDDDVKPLGDYLILRYSFNPTKIFTRLAAQGYRPEMIGMYFAVLHRKDSEPLGIKYDSTDFFPDTIKKLATIKGARYDLRGINIYLTDNDMNDSKPFFSVPLSGAVKNYRYEFVDLTNFDERYSTRKIKTSSIMDVPEPFLLERFRAKLREGYTLRDIYQGRKEITAVFEREVN